MNTSVATSVDDICGGSGDAMVGTTDESDLFLGMGGESRELCFSWAEDNESRTIIVGGGDHTVLPSPPLKNGDVTPKTREQISHAKNNKPQMKVYNFNDLFSPSRPTESIPHPSNDDQGRVRMDTDMEPPRQEDPEVMQAALEEQAQERKKRISWTKDEQKLFLMGVMIFNEQWREIRKHFVRTKSSTQIGSHVQKFKKRKDQAVANRKRCTVNDITVDDITREDVVRLAPKKWRPAVLSAMASCSNGGKTLVQQSPNAALQETATGHSAPTLLRSASSTSLAGSVGCPIQVQCSLVPAVQQSLDFTMQPASTFVSFGNGLSTPLMQAPPRPNLRTAYLGYPSSSYSPSNYHQMSLPQLATASSLGSYYSNPMRWDDYPSIAPPPALQSSSGIMRGWNGAKPSDESMEETLLC